MIALIHQLGSIGVEFLQRFKGLFYGRLGYLVGDGLSESRSPLTISISKTAVLVFLPTATGARIVASCLHISNPLLNPLVTIAICKQPDVL